MNIEHLYIHVPFCKSRCTYCAFYSTIHTSLQNQWYTAINNQLKSFSAQYEIKKLKTVYIGGGSPSAVDSDVLLSILHCFDDFCSSDTEFTIELNPADISDELTRILKDTYVNRVSLGIESFNDTVRTAVKRRGKSSDVQKVIQLLQNSTKFSVACDLMYGLPFQTPEVVQDDIKTIVALHPDHISYYELILEDSSELAHQLHENVISLPSHDENDRSWEIILSTLLDAEYERYEVSNWAYNGKYCYHNINYWQMGSWLGIGPSAVSNIDKHGSYIRIATVSNLNAYINNVLACSSEFISGKNAVIEYCMMQLRKKNGFSTDDFYERFPDQFHEIPEWLCKQFPLYLTTANNHITSNNTGLDNLNYIIVKLMQHMEQYT